MTTIGASGADNRPFAPALFAAIGDDFVLAVTPGVAGMPDSLWRLELDSGTATLVIDAGSAGAGFGCDSAMLSSSSATGLPTAAQSGSASSRAWLIASCNARIRSGSDSSGRPAPRSSERSGALPSAVR